MAITRTGSSVTVNATSDIDSQSITVPAGVDLCLMFLGGYESGEGSAFTNYSCSLGGLSFTHITRSPENFDDIAVAMLVSPPSGSQTLSWSVGTTNGPMFVLVFYAGVDTSAPILGSGGAGGNLTSLTVSGLTTAAGSMTVLGAVGDVPPDTAVSGQTAIESVGPAARVGTVYLSAGEKAEASAVSVGYSTEESYGGLVAVSLKVGSIPLSAESPAAMMMGL